MMLETHDIVAIHQLEALVHHAGDHSSQDMLDLVFTHDATFDGRLCGGPIFEGLDAIKGFFALGKPPHPLSHHMTNCWVYEKDDQICVKSKWFFPAADGSIVTGDNDDIVVKTSVGWRIRQRVAMMRFPAPVAL